MPLFFVSRSINEASPVEVADTYNFLNGLEQRYGVEAIGTKENQLFQKLNSIGNNEEVLFYQAIDEMMGHQYANVQGGIHRRVSCERWQKLRHPPEP